MRDRRGLAWDALLFLGFACAAWHYAGRLQASGDEPHYLLMAQSLWRERDLDLRDNYAREDFLDYTPGPLQPHYAAPRKDGRPYPAHAPGLPALLAPFYALGGRRACLVALAAMAAWLAREVRLLARQTAGSEEAAWFAWIAAAGPPVFFYSFHVYTEVPSALALALSLRLLLAGPSSVAAAAVAALAASTLPWLHVKMTLAAVALGAVALGRLRGKPLAVFVAIAGAAATAFVVYHQAVFGHPTPLAIYGGVPSDVVSSSPLRALVGLLLDRSFGLLPYAPVFVVALAGVVPLCRRPAGEWLPHVAVALGVLLPALAWRMWWGGLCPPARFLVPLVPFLGVAMACAIAAGGLLVRARWALLGAGWLLSLFLVWRPEDRLLLNRADQPTRLWEYTLPEVGRWLPSLVSAQPRELVLAIAWSVALGALLLLGARSRSD